MAGRAGVHDPFRPTIEPDGFVSTEEMMASRAIAVAVFRRAILESERFVFTSAWSRAGGIARAARHGAISATA